MGNYADVSAWLTPQQIRTLQRNDSRRFTPWVNAVTLITVMGYKHKEWIEHQIVYNQVFQTEMKKTKYLYLLYRWNISSVLFLAWHSADIRFASGVVRHGGLITAIVWNLLHPRDSGSAFSVLMLRGRSCHKITLTGQRGETNWTRQFLPACFAILCSTSTLSCNSWNEPWEHRCGGRCVQMY